ncbi:MAG: threonylcarbamoyl-AMP synthase [Candidatus Margulisiibacteriota bacterium]|nr:MAG: threonylcarbamoyl-AMP synthase [Candidatus Margulisbacteria bacterium GWE2_39_32]PZM83892.1 MAG: threonylcarbamoyl-AMP synthase [Candidatus Margulisiibacteriota bacterium]
MGFEQGEDVAKCKEVLRSGGVIAFPTDTVYGFGADIFCRDAIERIYAIKNRERDKPFLVNIGDQRVIYPYLKKITSIEKELMDTFWPGTLTIVLQVNEKVPDYIRRGHETLGVRIPNDPLALALLKDYPDPIISTSVNHSGELSSLTSVEVYDEFKSSIDYLFGNDVTCSGILSTIIIVVDDKIKILRSGASDEALYDKFDTKIIV